MLLSSNYLGIKSSSVLKLCSPISTFQSNKAVICIRRNFSTPRSLYKSNQGFGHASEETGENSKVVRNTNPDIHRGTTIQDLKSKDVGARKFAPKSHKDDLEKKLEIDRNIQKAIEQSRGNKDLNSTLTNLIAIGKLENISNGNDIEEPVELKFHDPSVEGHKFGLPELPIPPDANLKYREDTLVTQVTNLLMRDGKKGVAQRNMSFILNVLRTAPSPKFNPARPLIPGHPPAHHLSLDPVGYLTLAIDSVAPLLRIRSERGAAGGGAALSIPVPLRKRQRRRQAVMWILDSVNKRTSKGSGRGTFAQRFADEIINIVEGKSTAWDKRLAVHKAGTTSRNNINFKRRK